MRQPWPLITLDIRNIPVYDEMFAGNKAGPQPAFLTGKDNRMIPSRRRVQKMEPKSGDRSDWAMASKFWSLGAEDRLLRSRFAIMVAPGNARRSRGQRRVPVFGPLPPATTRMM